MEKKVTSSNGLLHIDLPLLAHQQRLTYIGFVWTLDVVWKTYQGQWIIEMVGERQSGNFVLSVQFDNDDICLIFEET